MSSRSLTLTRQTGGAGIWALLALVALIALLLAVTALQRADTDEAAPPFDLNSARPAGLLGLVRWLEAMGYRIERTDGRQVDDLPAAALLFVYPNQRNYTAGEAAQLQQWVAGGGTLFLAGPAPADTALAEVFGVRTMPATAVTAARYQAQPLVPEGRESYWPSLQFDAQALDLTGAPGAVVVLADDNGQAALAVQAMGDGVVWHAVPGLAFSNDGLRQNGQGELLPALLRTIPAGGAVVFDTAHLFGAGGANQPIATLQDWLYRTPGGWATLLGFAACAAFLLLQGRRLGPPLVTTAERPRREAAEHVRAMAAMARRAQLSHDLAEHQRTRLKRGLARRRAVSADLPDAAFVEQLQRATPAFAPAMLAQVETVLAGLRPEIDEQRLVTLAAQIDDILRQEGVQTFGT